MPSKQSKNVRSCIECRKREDPTTLLRTVCIEGKILPDPQAIAPGRGAWVHTECVALAVERRRFGRAYRLSDPGIELDAKALLTYVALLK